MRVRVLAGTRLEGHADRSVAGVVVRGTLRDDVGRPIRDNHVSIDVFDSNGGAAAKLPGTPRTCAPSAGGAREAHVAPDEYVVDTDALGSFCVITEFPTDRGTIKLSFGGGALYDKTQAEIPFDLSRPSIVLSFEPEPSIASLDRPMFSVGLRVAAPGVTKEGWTIVLKDERKRVLGTGIVEPDGLVRIDVPTDRLAEPGPGEIVASLEGTSLLASPVSHGIERHARVDLVLATPDPRGVPEDGVPLEIAARWARGAVPAGAVEASIGDRAVGAAPIRDGRAIVIATFAASHERAAPLALRYWVDAPWWEPGSPLRIALQVEPPSAWRRAPALLLALAVAAWMMRSSWLPRLARPRPQPTAAPRVAATTLEVIRPRQADQGWSGRVVDAHDGHPIRGASVATTIPSFPGAETRGASNVLSRTETDANGLFVLPPATFTGRIVLRVEARWHATFEHPLPPPSEISIPLVARRRQLLDRLVARAVHEWGPWRGTREPTPDQIASRARLSREGAGPKDPLAVETWARAVERAAFGREDVDEVVERSVASLEPARTPNADPRSQARHRDGRGSP